MPIRSVEVERIQQYIEEDLLTDLEQHPSRIKRWFIDNIFRRGLAYLVGFTEEKTARILKCTSAGILKVASVGAGLERVETKTGIATDVWSTPINLTYKASKIRIVSVDYGLLIKLSPDSSTWSDEVYIPAGQAEWFDLVVQSFKVKQYGLNSALYKVEGYR